MLSRCFTALPQVTLTPMSDNAAPLILLTRPRAQAERFAAQLAGLAEIRIIPLQEIVPTGPVPSIDGINGLIFTSENAVRLFAASSDRRDVPAWCVGGRTAETARGLGFESTAGGGSADRLIAAILEAQTPGPLLHVHGRHTRGAVASRLSERGIETRATEIYHQRVLAPSESIAPLANGRMVIAPLFSPRSAQLLAEQIGTAPGHWQMVCLSDAVRGVLPKRLQATATVAEDATSDAMVSLMKCHISP